MMIYLFSTIILNLILSLIPLYQCEEFIYNHKSKENNLFFVFTTFRHGARNPLTRVDFFGNFNYSAGALTEYGKLQHLEIGKIYRKRYSNFMNLSFDKNEIYIRTSNIKRAIISTEKELEGFFNKAINSSNIFIMNGGGFSINLFLLDQKERIEMKKYFESCPKRKLAKNYIDIYNREIFPNIKRCHLMENISDSGINLFCDSIISYYFEYIYNNKTNNIISRCSSENIKQFYDFCVEYLDSFRGFSEYKAYIFYNLFHHIFKFMNNAIEGKSKLKMMMIGGHDVTVSDFMNFLDGINIIPRRHYPHYACNIVIELRKYNYDFYLEFYYNNILKYNNTLKKFKSILDNSIYSNLYNFCGIPSPKSSLNKTINIKNKTIINNENSQNNSSYIFGNNQNNNKSNKIKKGIHILNNNKSNYELFSLNSTDASKIKKKILIILLNHGKNLLKKLINFFSQKKNINFQLIIICSLIVIIILIKLSIAHYINKKKKANALSLKKIKIQI